MIAYLFNHSNTRFYCFLLSPFRVMKSTYNTVTINPKLY
jgi:hypothetical protein